MRRSSLFVVIGFVVFVFLAISALLARALTASGTERTRVLDVAVAEARGDAAAVLRLTPACAAQPACAATVRGFVPALAHAGKVQILQYEPSVQMTLTRTTGSGRLAWRAGTGLSVVQCVRVRRDGPLTGNGVRLLSISAPMRRDASCSS